MCPTGRTPENRQGTVKTITRKLDTRLHFGTAHPRRTGVLDLADRAATRGLAGLVISLPGAQFMPLRISTAWSLSR